MLGVTVFVTPGATGAPHGNLSLSGEIITDLDLFTEPSVSKF